ncbi:MAG: hypothetical protein IID37_07070 [Planctomycetes bacterium]|nr:hypothetical protein [Planctomycetota bacterium]
MMRTYDAATIGRSDATSRSPIAGVKRWLRWCASGALLVSLVSCNGRDQEDPLIERVRSLTATVRTVTDAGLTLDENATPQQVVYALLQAIKDDVRAGNNQEERREAIDRQLALCAPQEIDLRFGGRRSIESREEGIYRVVRYWGAVVSYYVDDLDVNLETMTADMAVSTLPRGRANRTGTSELRKVILTLVDPQAPDDSRQRVRLRIDLAKESNYWRVCHVGYEPRPVVKAPVTTSTEG